MNRWREKMQRSIDEARCDSGVMEPERIFMADDVSIVSFERSEWTKLRDNGWLMDHFDLVMEIKRTGLFVVGDLIPTSINGYSVEWVFEVTPPEFVYEGCADVHFCIMLSGVHGGPTTFDKRIIFDLNGRECDDFFKRYVGTRIRETFEQLLLLVCRRANEMKADEIRGLADKWTYS